MNDFALVESFNLREFWKNLEEPFNYESEVEIAIDSSLSSGEAKVCHDSLLRSLDLIIFNKDKALEVRANEHCVCQQTNNILLISTKDARKLSSG